MKTAWGFLIGLICGGTLIVLLQNHIVTASAETVKTAQTQPGKLCLKNGVCIKDDFSTGKHGTKQLQEMCRKFDPSGGSEDFETAACFNLLQGFQWALNIDTFIRLKEGRPSGSFCFYGKEGFVPYTDSLPIYFLRYLEDHPEMYEKSISYVLYKMYEDNGQRCDHQETQKTGETQK